MKGIFASALIALTSLAFSGNAAHAQERLPEYIQAEKFTQDRLNTMLFSTMVDPHWFGDGKCFWYEYKTSEGNFWYVVNPAAKTKSLLFDRDEIAAQLTEIVKDPYEARHLPIRNLKAKEDGRTFTFEVRSTRDIKNEKGKKEKGSPTQTFRHLKPIVKTIQFKREGETEKRLRIL